MRLLSQGKSRWETPILNLICHVNPDSEYSITQVQHCIRIHSQQPSSRLYRIETHYSWLKTTQDKKAKEARNEILNLK